MYLGSKIFVEMFGYLYAAATFDVLPNAHCDNAFTSATGKMCRHDLYCDTCPGAALGAKKLCLAGSL